MANLLSSKRGQYTTIKGISVLAPIKIKRRLLELGFTRGVKARVVRKSLLGNAYMIELRGYTLTLRKDIVSFLQI
ncbi:MAG: ferrous iron transport protein A [Clostridia bacterium]|jgi:Fe2+ transport system protein FeoA|nr:ferrous iron transport protein A [Clostridia bacterium]